MFSNSTKLLLPSVFCLFLQVGNVHAESFSIHLVKAAQERTKHSVSYDGSYVSISYPMGDVPQDQGVCTDLIIRAYRALGIDLQQQVHEDMHAHFSKYPDIWGLQSTDTNIDHRRVPNLQTFFTRNGTELLISNSATDYKPGELVTWMLPGNLPHIGIVSDQFAFNTNRPKIIHNIGSGPVEDDILFKYKITGHYSYKN